MTRDESDPVSILISRRMRPGMEQQAASLGAELSTVALSFPGCVSVRHVEPAQSPHGMFLSLLQFDSVESLTAWESSRARANWLDYISKYVEDERTVRQPATGLENLFEALSLETLHTPRRFKMALVLVAVIYSLLMLFRFILGPPLSGVPDWLQTLVMVSAQVMVMTYLVMPWVTRKLGGWLHR